MRGGVYAKQLAAFVRCNVFGRYNICRYAQTTGIGLTFAVTHAKLSVTTMEATAKKDVRKQ